MAVINSGRMLQVIVNLSIEGARKNAAYIGEATNKWASFLSLDIGLNDL